MVKITGTAGPTKLILAILFVLSFAYLIVAVYQVSSLEKSVEHKQKELETYQKDGLTKLNREKVRLEKQLKAIESSYDEITGLVAPNPKSRMSKDPGDPLKFKEELYKVQNKLKEDGKSVNFEFPFWLGFDKYEHDIPTAADLPLRVKQLDIIKEAGTLMLNNKISTIAAVEFGDIKNISAEGGKDIVYKEFPLKIGFVCTNENLINFLHTLTISDIAFKVDYMKLKASEAKAEGKGDLSVELIITAAVFP
ncbi:MAG: Amuc_1100 family pilus-like protein [Candidatus Omnitrophota bacterium]|nr:Amuc_1100 family pilus-like protein [Candidatus Omnitrophota bacterium]